MGDACGAAQREWSSRANKDMWRRTTSRLAFLVLLLGSGRVGAEETALRRARAPFDEAESQYRLGRFAEALTGYRAALELARRPNLLFNIAQCYRQLGDHPNALFYYELYLADSRRARPGKPVPYEKEVRQHMARLRSLLAESARPGASLPVLRPPPSPPERPLSAPPDTGNRWLVVGLSTMGTALLFAGLAGLCYGTAADYHATDPAHDTYSALWGVSLGLAVTSALASGVSWYLFYRRSGSRGAKLSAMPGWSVTVEPTPRIDGWTVVGSARF
jgi:tetratricopeptide (TPR) repeat protein